MEAGYPGGVCGGQGEANLPQAHEADGVKGEGYAHLGEHGQAANLKQGHVKLGMPTDPSQEIALKARLKAASAKKA
jgi:hypothetical protein